MLQMNRNEKGMNLSGGGKYPLPGYLSPAQIESLPG